jgi:hypothetical protein
MEMEFNSKIQKHENISFRFPVLRYWSFLLSNSKKQPLLKESTNRKDNGCALIYCLFPLGEVDVGLAIISYAQLEKKKRLFPTKSLLSFFQTKVRTFSRQFAD